MLKNNNRYGGAKLERARDLFETALKDAPPEKAKPLFLEYAALEEQHGLARHAMEVCACEGGRGGVEMGVSKYK